MPHTGKPSGACQICKQRHVKCDETRPACLKCIGIQRICPGYTEGLDLVLRDQNQIAKAGSERRHKAHAKKKNQTHLNGSSSDSSSGFSSRSDSPTSSSDDELIIYSSIAESRDSYAHAFFVSAYVLGPRDTRTDHGFLELLPYLFDKLPFDPVLSSSLAVLCHCYFGAWHPPIRNAENFEVRQTYSKALSGLRHALKDPRHCVTDELLMSVCLLNFFEFTTSALTSRPRGDQHIDGATALVKQRGSKRMTSDLSKRLLIAVRHDMIGKALARSLPIDDAPEIWDDPSEDMPYNPATSLDFIGRDTANLLARAAEHGLPSNADSSDREIHTNIFLEAKALDARYAQWAEQVPTEWLPFSVPRELIPQEIIDAGVNGDYCHIYSHTSVCSTWDTWRVQHIRVLSLIADYEETEAKNDAVLRIQRLADDIHASLPFMLGNKVKASEMHDMDFVYPSILGQSVPASHYQSAAAYGGLTLWVPMRAILDFARYMRGDQILFTIQQFQRIGRLYDVRNTQ
ncbi:MAG: hypothetical protein L6R38_009077 [Xanthoria sp. 2 TBL-2021]|nr:MAG: hypothetical protein L6R38_009077 [Xanthoria sp. 2 TBL-2021]